MKSKVMILSGIFTMVFLFVVGFSPANAAIPYTVNYQGYLTNAVSSPVNGTVSMTFSLYTAASGGTALWTETQNVIVSGGIYGVILGSVSALTPVAFDVPYWLGVRVGSDAEMTPRVQLTSVGYAFTSDMAMDLVCPGCVNFSDIGQNGCAANQFMMWSGTAWTCSAPTVTETDPQVGTLTANLWCRSNAGGTAIDCATAAPVTAETDPQVGTLTANLWCRSNAGGTAIDCATAAPITAETDPEVGALTANLWCRSNAGGTAIDCATAAPVTAETDPQVGTLTANLWCRSNAGGTAIDCATAAPITAETDPQVGVVTAGQWCVGSGTAVECNQDAAALFVNVTGDAMTGALTVDGNVDATGTVTGNTIKVVGGPVASQPACDSTRRGMLWFTQGITGGGATTDTLEVCAKDALDAYAWQPLY